MFKTFFHPSYPHTSVSINDVGATVTSWKVNDAEILFTSKNTILDGSKGIRGGIPIVFPQFGPGSLRQHGFARDNIWKFRGASLTVDDSFVIEYVLPSSATNNEWDKCSNLTLKVHLTYDSLKTELTVENNGRRAFTCDMLFHTYFRIPDISKVSISGLKGINYIDKTSDSEKVSNEDLFTITKEEDAIFKNVFSHPDDQNDKKSLSLFLSEGPIDRIELATNGLPDVVVWNGWSTKCDKMADMEPEGWKRYLCVEPGNLNQQISIESGNIWVGSQMISVRMRSAYKLCC